MLIHLALFCGILVRNRNVKPRINQGNILTEMMLSSSYFVPTVTSYRNQCVSPLIGNRQSLLSDQSSVLSFPREKISDFSNMGFGREKVGTIFSSLCQISPLGFITRREKCRHKFEFFILFSIPSFLVLIFHLVRKASPKELTSWTHFFIAFQQTSQI